MPNYTKNLGLTKPLPEEFYDVNVRNENWDKIDHAIGALNGGLETVNAKSSEYNMDTVLAGGAHLKLYDTNADTLGTPYKYGKTNLTAASILSYANGVNFGIQVAWIAGGVSFVRGMSGAVIGEWGQVPTMKDIVPEKIGAEKVLGVVPDDDFFVWVEKQTTGGSFLIAPDRTTSNVPAVSWFIGRLDYNVSGKRITMTELNTLKTWVNVTRNNVFTGWFKLANADDVVSKAGGDVLGELFFKNFNDYYMLKKGRTLPNGTTHFLTMGLSSGGSTTLEHYTCPTQNYDAAMLDGRLELGQVAGENGLVNSHALILRADNANGQYYRIFGEHFSPAVVATAELV